MEQSETQASLGDKRQPCDQPSVCSADSSINEAPQEIWRPSHHGRLPPSKLVLCWLPDAETQIHSSLAVRAGRITIDVKQGLALKTGQRNIERGCAVAGISPSAD